MENQVLSIEQMKYLQELGVDTSKASCYWWYAEGKNYLYWGKCSDVNGIPTFTLQDMLEMMPKTILFKDETYHFEMLKGNERYTICYSRVNDDNEFENYIVITESNILTCIYETLCWLVRNKYIGGKK